MGAGARHSARCAACLAHLLDWLLTLWLCGLLAWCLAGLGACLLICLSACNACLLQCLFGLLAVVLSWLPIATAACCVHILPADFDKFCMQGAVHCSLPVPVPRWHCGRPAVGQQQPASVSTVKPHRTCLCLPLPSIVCHLQGAVHWSLSVGPGGTVGGLQWGSAADTSRIYVANNNHL